jgi:hypothetical protein
MHIETKMNLSTLPVSPHYKDVDLDLINTVEKEIQKRDKFNYTLRDLFYQTLICKSLKRCREKCQRYQNIQKLYDKGVDRYSHELDCVEIVQALRKLKTVANITMTEQQQIMQNFSNDGVLSLKDKPPLLQYLQNTSKESQKIGRIDANLPQHETDRAKLHSISGK